MVNATQPKDAHGQLIGALLSQLPGAAIIATCAQPWTSRHFNGSRHLVELALLDMPGSPAAALCDADMPLSDHVLLDILTHRPTGDRITIEALTAEGC